MGAGALVLGVLVVRIGSGPFVDGVRLTSAWSLLAATALTAVSTLCSAWRWQLVAGGLGIRIDLLTAVLAVYRAQFLNATLPGGVLGDVDRALGHGRVTGAVGRSVRSVVWERTLGQLVQFAITMAILVALPSSLRPVGLVGLAACAAGLVLVCLIPLTTRKHVMPARAARAVAGDLSSVLGSWPARGGIALASATAVACHLLVFMIAARVVGVAAASYQVLSIAAVVLLAAAVPANVAGWGPREGVAAWAFAGVGLGAAAGVTTAVVYGVMALVATLPGSVVLLVGRSVPTPPVLPNTLRTTEEVVGV